MLGYRGLGVYRFGVEALLECALYALGAFGRKGRILRLSVRCAQLSTIEESKIFVSSFSLNPKP